MPIDPKRLAEAARRLKAEADAKAGSAEEYIRKKLEAARAAALEKSRTRTEVVTPTVTVRLTNKQVADSNRESAKWEREHGYRLLEDGRYYDYARSLALERELLHRADSLSRENPSGLFDEYSYEGPNCIYNATDAYGKQYRVAGNQSFFANPKKYGFIQIPYSEKRPGDIVQDVNEVRGVPEHGMIFDGFVGDIPVYNYSPGVGDVREYVRAGGYYGKGSEADRNAFRFVGTPADSLRWRNEFESGQFGCGGRKFDGGGRYFRADLGGESPLMYEPMPPVYNPIVSPLRFRPEPDLGDWVEPTSTGMVVGYPIGMDYSVPDSGYGVLEPEVAPAIPALDPKKDAARRIMAVENSKKYVGGGWDAKTGRWYPHKSVEGGADTIAYGIKLSNGTPEAKLALKQGYLTDEQATEFVDTLVNRYYDAAKRVYDKKYGDGEWDKLSDKSQSILVDYSYNPGLQKFPKLMEGFHSGDLDMIRENYKRYVNGKELGRNKILLEELDTLENEYPIFRASGGKIHIKPENRGKFTALKKRTGHSASWFKAHGTPAQKKMAVFALNSKHWSHKHADGGQINEFGAGGPGSINGYPAVPSLMMKLLDPQERRIIGLDIELRKMAEERERKKNEYRERKKEIRDEFDAAREEARGLNDYKRDRFNAIIDNNSAPVYILRSTIDGTLLQDFNGNDLADAQETDRAVFGYPPINYEERDLGDKIMYRSYFDPDAWNVAPTWRTIYHRKGEKPDTVMYEEDRDLWKKIDEAAISVLPEISIIYKNKKVQPKPNVRNNSIAFPFSDGGYLLGNIYDLSEEQVNELIRQGYEVERV